MKLTSALQNYKRDKYKHIMAQLDLTTYATQVFWLLLFFILLYIIMYYIVLPQVAYILKLRVFIFKSFSEEQLLQQKSDATLDNYIVQFCRAYCDTTQKLVQTTNTLLDTQKRSILNTFVPNVLVRHILVTLIKN